MTLPPEAYLWFKTLHIVGVVVWFAGLFYLVRLFIYHVETAELEPALQQPFRDQYTLMEKRLANICLLYTSPSPRDATLSRMPSSA